MECVQDDVVSMSRLHQRVVRVGSTARGFQIGTLTFTTFARDCALIRLIDKDRYLIHRTDCGK